MSFRPFWVQERRRSEHVLFLQGLRAGPAYERIKVLTVVSCEHCKLGTTNCIAVKSANRRAYAAPRGHLLGRYLTKMTRGSENILVLSVYETGLKTVLCGGIPRTSTNFFFSKAFPKALVAPPLVRVRT